MPDVNIGEILLLSAKNAEHLHPELQKVIAQYCGYFNQPVMFKGMPLKVDPNLKAGQIRFDHPDGRKDKVQL